MTTEEIPFGPAKTKTEDRLLVGHGRNDPIDTPDRDQNGHGQPEMIDDCDVFIPEPEPKPETAIAVASPAALPAVAPATATDSLIAMALDKDLDITKLEALLAMKEKEEAKTAKAQFNVAMARVQLNAQPVVANAENEHTGSSYAKMDAIIKGLAPVYGAEGFSATFGTAEPTSERLIQAGFFRVTGELNHAGGHTKNYYVDLPVDDKGIGGKVNKTAIHGTKSTITYGRVIIMGLMFNFATTLDVDDDGNAAGTRPELITDHQVCEINEAIEAGAVSKPDLLKFAGVESFDQIYASNWPRLYSLIQRKYKIAEKGEGNAE